MVLKFRIISNEQDDFVRDFEILDKQSFFDLHMLIQDNLQFDKSQIASFFICNQDWEKEQEIALFELSDEESAKVITMENAILKDHMFDVHDKMIYVFDVFNERLFFIELVEKSRKNTSLHYPRCSFEKGHVPPQLLMDYIFGTPDLSNGAILDDLSMGEEFLDPGNLEELDYDTGLFEDELPDE